MVPGIGDAAGLQITANPPGGNPITKGLMFAEKINATREEKAAAQLAKRQAGIDKIGDFWVRTGVGKIKDPELIKSAIEEIKPVISDMQQAHATGDAGSFQENQDKIPVILGRYTYGDTQLENLKKIKNLPPYTVNYNGKDYTAADIIARNAKATAKGISDPEGEAIYNKYQDENFFEPIHEGENGVLTVHDFKPTTSIIKAIKPIAEPLLKNSQSLNYDANTATTTSTRTLTQAEIKDEVIPNIKANPDNLLIIYRDPAFKKILATTQQQNPNLDREDALTQATDQYIADAADVYSKSVYKYRQPDKNKNTEFNGNAFKLNDKYFTVTSVPAAVVTTVLHPLATEQPQMGDKPAGDAWKSITLPKNVLNLQTDDGAKSVHGNAIIVNKNTGKTYLGTVDKQNGKYDVSGGAELTPSLEAQVLSQIDDKINPEDFHNNILAVINDKRGAKKQLVIEKPFAKTKSHHSMK